MTATQTTAYNRATAAPSVEVVREATNRLLTAISTVDPDDHRWDAVGPLVSTAAARLRKAIGRPVVDECVGAPSIVRERDLSTAAHGLLARDVRVVNDHAVRQFLQLARDATVAFS